MDLENVSSVFVYVENSEESKNLSCPPDKLGSDTKSKDVTNGVYIVVNDDACENGTGFSNSSHVETTKLDCSFSPVTAKRGQGLKKWRRIRRGFSKGSDSDVDTSKHLSPERASLGPGSSKRQVRAVRYEKGEGSSSSTNAVVRDFDGNGLVGEVFAGGADSESSKSSTAASAPKMKHDRMSSGKSLTQSIQQGKGRPETSKKDRGKIEMETSYSSVESDLRSSGFVFMQGKQFTSNGMHNESIVGYECDGHDNAGGYGGNGDRGYEKMSSKGSFADAAWEVKVERTNGHSSFHSSSTDQDLLLTLQGVPKALEREVLKFKEISKYIDQTSEAVETSFKTAQSEIVETTSRHVENELEDFFEKKIEAEVEYLVMSRKDQIVRTNCVDQLTLLEEQKALASEQTHMLSKLEDTENKAATLKIEAEKLESICEDIAHGDKTLKLQNSVCKYTCCFFVQLLLLVVIIAILFSELPTSSVEIVPT